MRKYIHIIRFRKTHHAHNYSNNIQHENFSSIPTNYTKTVFCSPYFLLLDFGRYISMSIKHHRCSHCQSTCFNRQILIEIIMNFCNCFNSLFVLYHFWWRWNVLYPQIIDLHQVEHQMVESTIEFGQLNGVKVKRAALHEFNAFFFLMPMNSRTCIEEFHCENIQAKEER